MGVGRINWLVYSCGLVLLLVAQSARSEPSGQKQAGDRVTVHVERIDSLHVEAVVELANRESIAALTLPLKWGNGRSLYRLDSADYRGMRTDYFALKTFRVDSTVQSVLIGLISDLGGNYPPLEPGEGGIVRLHFSSRRPTRAQLTIDTTFFPPHNTLQLVTPDVRAIQPLFEGVSRPKP